MRLAYIDYHTCGEPVRIVTSGYPQLTGAGILDKRRQARKSYDHVRRAMMLEPRGHDGMYGVIPVAASHLEAAFGVLFTHNEGYSTMCGHATIALGRYAIEQGLVEASEPVTRFAIEAPCGLVRLACEVEDGQGNWKVGDVSFESVPAFVEARDLVVPVPGYGDIVTDIAYGGAYYCILPASGFLYGTIVTDEAEPDRDSFNLCVFAERQIDRSPTGSGVTARMALDHAKGLIPIGRSRRIRSITGGTFTGKVIGPADFPAAGAVTVEVGGRGHLAGDGSFVIEADDPLGHGFALPKRFAEIAG